MSERFEVTRDEIREAVRVTFYPAIPLGDQEGQARARRAADRMIEALETIQVERSTR